VSYLQNAVDANFKKGDIPKKKKGIKNLSYGSQKLKVSRVTLEEIKVPIGYNIVVLITSWFLYLVFHPLWR